jgi:hypothetical protein
MRIAYCIAGELRSFDDENVRKYLKEFVTNPLNPDIFISVWDHIGFSAHQHLIQGGIEKLSKDFTIESIKESFPNIKDIKIENFDSWLDSTDPHLKEIFLNWKNKGEFSGYGAGSASSIPYMYKTHDSIMMKKKYEEENNFKYDIVLKGRPDLLFVNHLDLINYSKPNTIYHNNFGPRGWHWPNRIYDIFFYSDSPTMDKISNTWPNYRTIIDNPYDNGCGRLDPCRILYVQSTMDNINIESYPKRFCEVYRKDDVEFFINYTKQYDS